jgi:uncharacterized protein
MASDFDPTVSVPDGPNLIQGYRPDGFTIGGRRFAGAVLVLERLVVAWEVEDLDALTIDDFRPVIEAEPKVEILILGSGARFALAPPALRAALREHGIVLEAMDSGAACRTFNVLVAEDRRVAAALLPPR